jgi:tRNA/rRNA methyltransferase
MFVLYTHKKYKTYKLKNIRTDKINDLIKNKANTINNLAIVFGREESGLTNDELKLCDVVTSVPMKTTYPSLNLAQSVMIYAYTLSMLEYNETKLDQKSNQDKLNILKTNTENILSEIGFVNDSWRKRYSFVTFY